MRRTDEDERGSSRPDPVADRSPGLFGFRPLPPRGGMVSNELIDELRETDEHE